MINSSSEGQERMAPKISHGQRFSDILRGYAEALREQGTEDPNLNEETFAKFTAMSDEETFEWLTTAEGYAFANGLDMTPVRELHYDMITPGDVDIDDAAWDRAFEHWPKSSES